MPRITDTDSHTRPASTWLAGLALAMLGVGAFGAMQPLLPPVNEVIVGPANDEVPILDFQPTAPSTDPVEDQPLEPELEIPPIIEITPPLTPPEVPELTPLETPPSTPPPVIKPPDSKPEPKPAPKSPPRPAPAPKSSSGTGTNSSPTLFTGGGSGRFPSPTYPASARSARQQGSVRLLVTVETSGMPSSVEVQTSSGFPALDNAATDHIRRRWRWPAGDMRRFIVPVRFQLQ